MNNRTLQALERAFAAELEKTAALPPALMKGLGAARSYLGQQVGAIGTGTGLGAAGGALLGAGYKGHQAYSQAKEQGAGTGLAAAHALMGGLGGASTGALVGAGLGAGAGLASGGRGAELAKKLVQREGALGATSRFGQRQVHGLTGAVPQGFASTQDALRSMRTGATEAISRHDQAFKGVGAAAGQMDEALQGLRSAAAGTDHRAIADAASNLGAAQKAQRTAQSAWTQAEKGRDAALRAEEMGLTNAPGYLKSLVSNPLETVRTSVGAEWHGGGAGHKALMFGLPAAMAVGELATPSQEGGPGKAERVAKGLAHMAVPMGVMPLGANMAVGSALGRGLGVVGAGVDARTRRNRQPLPGPEGDASYAPAVQREYSNAALGKPPEDVG